MSDYTLIHLEEISSTNTYLKNILPDLSIDIKDMVVVYTDFQTEGRGQRGNRWEADRGLNLLFSVVLFPQNLNPSNQFYISEMISLALKIVLDQYTTDISIKWPNDIYWKEKKIAGILIENAIQGDVIENSIIGVGLNLNQEIFTSDAPNPISLYQIIEKTVVVRDVLSDILNKFVELQQSEFIDIHRLYMQSLFRKDGCHLFKDKQGSFKAKINRVKTNGMLELETEDCSFKEYAFKEVQFVLE